MRKINYFKLANKNFVRNGLKTITPIIIITLGIIIFNVVAGLFSVLKETTRENITDNDNLKIIKAYSKDASKMKLNELNQLKNVPGVLTSLPVIESNVTFDKCSTILLGVDNKALSFFTSAQVSNLNKNEIIVNENLKSYVKEGRPINLEYIVKVAAGQGANKTIKAKVNSFYQQPKIPDIPPEDISLASIDFVENLKAEFEGLPLSVYRKNISYETVFIIVKDVNSVRSIANELENKGYSTSYALQAGEGIPTIAKVAGAIGGIIILMLLVFAGLSISSIINQSIQSRYKEIGIMRSIGYQRNHIVKIYYIEVMYIALISFIISILSSLIIIKVLNYFINQSEMLQQLSVNLDVYWINVMISLLLIIFVSVSAATRPIMRATSLTITDLMRK